ncbi:MAG: class I SAM-dependent methyltransferase [Candidatus Thorarchaeota archaeon]
MKLVGYDAIGGEYEAAYGNNPSIVDAIEWITENVPVGGKILDVGSGTGTVAKLLSENGFKVLGIDNSNIMNKIARNKAPKARFLELNIKKIYLNESEFNVITAFFSLLHIEKSIFKRTIRKILGYLIKDGYFIISMVEGNIDKEDHFMGQKLHFSSYRKKELIEIVNDLNLDIIEIRENKFTPNIKNAETENQIFIFSGKK